MVDTTRQGKRAPVSLKIKFKSETLDQFIERYAVDVSQGGIFIRTKEPLAIGTAMKFEFQLKDGSSLIGGDGTVVWTREHDPTRPGAAPGMGVRFDKLADGSQPTLEKILAEKAKQPAKSDRHVAETRPPEFNDAPTRVAPSPLVGQLMNAARQGSAAAVPVHKAAPHLAPTRAHSDGDTPLPGPLPSQSQFAKDQAGGDFEFSNQATRVGGSLAEMVARGASENRSDADIEDALSELAARRSPRAATANPAAVERTLAPAAPFVAAPRPNTQLPEVHAVTRPPTAPISEQMPVPMSSAPLTLETRGTTEPPPRSRRDSFQAPSRAQSAPAAEPPPAKKRSVMPIVLSIIGVGGASFAALFFVLRPKPPVVVIAPPQVPIAIAPPPVVKPADVVVAPAVTTPDAAAVSGTATVAIESDTPNASVEIIGTNQGGPTPFHAVLENGKSYTARFAAPGYESSEKKFTATSTTTLDASLVAKPRVLHVNSTPSSAMIFIDGVSTGKTTPADITLNDAQGKLTELHLSLTKVAYAAWAETIEGRSFIDEGKMMKASAEATLTSAGSVARHSGASSSNKPPQNGSSTPSNTTTTPPNNTTTTPEPQLPPSVEPTPDFMKQQPAPTPAPAPAAPAPAAPAT